MCNGSSNGGGGGNCGDGGGGCSGSGIGGGSCGDCSSISGKCLGIWQNSICPTIMCCDLMTYVTRALEVVPR